MSDPLPRHPPARKIRYKAIYHDQNQNPFRGRGPTVPFKTVDIDATVPIADVEQMARDARENYEFVCVEVVARG